MEAEPFPIWYRLLCSFNVLKSSWIKKKKNTLKPSFYCCFYYTYLPIMCRDVPSGMSRALYQDSNNITSTDTFIWIRVLPLLLLWIGYNFAFSSSLPPSVVLVSPTTHPHVGVAYSLPTFILALSVLNISCTSPFRCLCFFFSTSTLLLSVLFPHKKVLWRLVACYLFCLHAPYLPPFLLLSVTIPHTF